MAQTNSLAFPNMLDVARNRVGVFEDTASVTNRTKLLILTEPTELYNSPTFGVGLSRYLFQYNTKNQQSILKDRIVAQLSLHEPCVIADETVFVEGLQFSDSPDALISAQDYNKLKMTVGLRTVFGDNVTVSLNDNADE